MALLHHTVIPVFWKLVQGSSIWLSRTGEFAPIESSKNTGSQPWPHKKTPSRSTHKSENEKYNSIVQRQECKSSHNRCSLDMGFVSRNNFKQLNTTKSLNPLLDFFSKGCTQSSAQIPAHHMLCKKTCSATKMLFCGQDIYKTHRKQDK